MQVISSVAHVALVSLACLQMIDMLQLQMVLAAWRGLRRRNWPVSTLWVSCVGHLVNMVFLRQQVTPVRRVVAAESSARLCGVFRRY